MICRLILITFLAILAACHPATSPEDRDEFGNLLSEQSPHYEQANQLGTISFPEDHGSHNNFRMEWWYITANLKDDKGSWYGAQWTLFRNGLNGPSELGLQRQFFMGHAALSWQNGHHAMEKYARAGTGQAGVISQPFSAWIDQWHLRSLQQSWLPLLVSASDQNYSFALTLSSDLPPVLQGNKGFSIKNHQGSGSYYYSHPYLHVQGEIIINEKPVTVTGKAWLDREWSSQFLLPVQEGWDWFAIHLDSGEKIMVYQLRYQSGETKRSLTWFDANAQLRVKTEDIQLIPLQSEMVANRKIPQKWRLKADSLPLDIILKSRHKDHWMNLDYPYWEGPITITGTHTGEGYMEMTGY